MNAERGYGNPGLPPNNAQLLFIFLYSLFWLCVHHGNTHCTGVINNAMLVHAEISLPRRRWVDSRQLAYGRVIRSTLLLLQILRSPELRIKTRNASDSAASILRSLYQNTACSSAYDPERMGH